MGPEATSGAGQLAERLAAVRARIARACDRAGRDPHGVELLAVTKGVPAAQIVAAARLGAMDLGENYVQEWLAKEQAVSAEISVRWTFIGALQRNKAARVAERAFRVQSVDRAALADTLGDHAAACGRILPVLVQVNLGEERQKAGVWGAEAMELARRITAHPALRLDGLMSLPPPRDAPEQSRADHRALADLRRQIEGELGCALPVLSMGMSADLEVAIEEGSTQVRVGTAIFGPRG